MARIAVVIPCYNEERTIGQVVRDFARELPEAQVHVCDNGSSDRTVEQARSAGARIHRAPRRGKGHALRALFEAVDADVYLMVDGDGTYPASQAAALIGPVLGGEAEMVIGSRLHPASRSRFLIPHLAGNLVIRAVLRLLFRCRVTDVLSGYRALSREAVRAVPLMSQGFEAETELTVKCFQRGCRVAEVPVDLAPRPSGSYSKIRFWSDGLLILGTLFALARDYKPLTLFGTAGLLCAWIAATGGAAWAPELRFALLAAGVLLIAVGVILHSIARHFQELEQRWQRMDARRERFDGASPPD